MQLTEAIIELVKAGLGITVMARWAIKPYVESGQLIALPLTEVGLYRTWYAVTLQEGSRFLGKFVEHLVTHLAEFIEM